MPYIPETLVIWIQFQMDTWIASREYGTALTLSRLNVKEEESGVNTWTILGDAWMSYLTKNKLSNGVCILFILLFIVPLSM